MKDDLAERSKAPYTEHVEQLEYKDPVAGLIIYDFDQELIHVELNGIARNIWGK